MSRFGYVSLKNISPTHRKRVIAVVSRAALMVVGQASGPNSQSLLCKGIFTMSMYAFPYDVYGAMTQNSMNHPSWALFANGYTWFNALSAVHMVLLESISNLPPHDSSVVRVQGFDFCFPEGESSEGHASRLWQKNEVLRLGLFARLAMKVLIFQHDTQLRKRPRKDTSSRGRGLLQG